MELLADTFDKIRDAIRFVRENGINTCNSETWKNHCEEYDLLETESYSIQEEIESLHTKVAASQTREQQLRGQILLMIDSWWPFVHGSFPSDTARDMFRKASDSIQPPHDTAALSAMIAKAEKMTIERCASFVDDSCTYGDTHILVKAVRALPTGNMKLEELL